MAIGNVADINKKDDMADHPCGIAEMYNAAEGLADGNEPFYYRVW